jgi:RHS repeat-associated protein
MDNLTYRYNNNNNQLNHIEETVGVSSEDDLDAQSNNNYLYDACGRIKQDGSKQMFWNNSGLIKEVRNAHAGNMQYGYDAFNRRMWEKKNGALTDFYVNDVSGNRIASYKISGSLVTCKAISVYGASRLGEYELNREARSVLTDSGNFYRGVKRYEVVNHIGDVQAVITDKRLRVGEDVKATVVTATEYYPFGMVMPGRKYGDRNYRYGFQGMECDDDVANDDNEYTTEFRQYDPRVGRWMSVDPKANEIESPYVAFSNNPITVSDPLGDTVLSTFSYEELYEDVDRRLMRSDFSYNSMANEREDLMRRVSEVRPEVLDPAVSRVMPEEIRRLNNMLQRISELSVSMRTRVDEEITQQVGSFEVNPYYFPQSVIRELEELPAIDINWHAVIREELEVITGNGLGAGSGNSFSAFYFMSLVNSGVPRWEALERTRSFNTAWDNLSGAASLTGELIHGDDNSGEDLSSSSRDVIQHLETIVRAREAAHDAGGATRSRIAERRAARTAATRYSRSLAVPRRR